MCGGVAPFEGKPEAENMNERKDPLALWVGTWRPEDVIDRETRVLTRRDPPERPGDQPADADPRNQ